MRAWWFRINGDEKGKKSKGNRDNGHQNISSGGVDWGGGEEGEEGGWGFDISLSNLLVWVSLWLFE